MQQRLTRLLAQCLCAMSCVIFYCAVLNSAMAAEQEGFLPSIDAAHISYPLRDMSLILPAGIPGQDDMCLPRLVPLLKQHTSRLLVPTIRQGRGGSYALNALLRSPADGYTVALFSLPSLILQTFKGSDALYSLNDVVPITVMGKMPLALWVAEDSPYITLEDFLRDARVHSSANNMYVAGAGSYTGAHMVLLQLNRAAGITVQYAPLISTKGCMEAVRSKKVQGMWAGALHRNTLNGMRPLVTTGAERSAVLPDVPTLQEYNLPIEHEELLGLAVLAETSEKMQRDAAAFFTRLTRSPEFEAMLHEVGIEPVQTAFDDIPRLMEQQQAQLKKFAEDYPMF